MSRPPSLDSTNSPSDDPGTIHVRTLGHGYFVTVATVVLLGHDESRQEQQKILPIRAEMAAQPLLGETAGPSVPAIEPP